MSNYSTFRQYNNIDVANEICEHLKANSIECIINDNKRFFDVNFSNTPFENNISLNLQPQDFKKAQSILDLYYNQQIESVSSDYYLYQFSDKELLEIISKPDEWGEFDFHLAKKILAEGGKAIKPEIVELLKEQRIDELSKPEVVNKYFIYQGYLAALFGGVIAIFWGYDMAYSKRTLPDGKQVYAYNESERKHGERITLIGIISLIIWLGVFIMIKINQYNP
ncbi:MAG: hypothetical protein QM802_14830 [Agriterribacter sp.]